MQTWSETPEQAGRRIVNATLKDIAESHPDKGLRDHAAAELYRRQIESMQRVVKHFNEVRVSLAAMGEVVGRFTSAARQMHDVLQGGSR